MLDIYFSALYNATLGIFLKELLQRLTTLIVIISLCLKLIDFNQFVLYYIISQSLPSLFIVIALINEKQFFLKPNFDFIDKLMLKEIIDISAFGLIGGFSSIAIANIDSIMINAFVDLESTGIYGITFFFGTLIVIPARTIRKIVIPLLSDAWKEGEMENIKELYYKSSKYQFLIGALVLVGIWANIHNVFSFIPKEYEAGKYVIFFIGLANLFEILIGVGSTIIITSEFYRMQAYIGIILIVLAIIYNLIFIPILGLTGAAIASSISMLSVFLIRYLFLWNKFKFQPLKIDHFYIVVVAIFCFLFSKRIPIQNNFIIDILIRSSIILILYFTLLFLLKTFSDLNGIIKGYIKKHI